jgi:hypothetical protein
MDIVAWATARQVEISVVVPPVACGGETVEGLVATSAAEVMPMFRHVGSGLEHCRVRRVRRADEQNWLYITDPTDGVAVGPEDLVVVAAEMSRFEQENSIFGRAPSAAIAVPSSHPSKYDWDAMWVHVLQRVHEQGLPETQREFVNEIQEWFIRRSPDGDAPDERTIRRRLTPAWRTLRAEDDG